MSYAQLAASIDALAVGNATLTSAAQSTLDVSNENVTLAAAQAAAAAQSAAAALAKWTEIISVADKGAHPSLADNATQIQAAIDQAYARGGGEVWFFLPGVYTCSKLTLKKGVVLRASFGTVELKLKNGSNTALLESLGFDSLYVSASTPGTDTYELPLDFGFDGLILNGNRANQTTRVPLVKFYGARLAMNGHIYGSKGPGLRTACFGSHSQSRKTPGNVRELEIFDCDEEAWIFEGPSDQYFGQLVINGAGDPANNGTVPQTSTTYPGEPVHGLRLQSGSMHVASMNVNGVKFGRGIYANGRMKFGDVIAAGNWGNLYTTAAAFGTINSLHVQANPYAWTGVVNPSVENLSDDVQYANVTALRVTGQDQMTAPLIVDSGGAQWGNVRNRQALVEGGTFFKANAAGITIANLDAKGADVALHTTTSANRITVNCTFNNCNTVWLNEASYIKGAWNFTGDIGAAQTFATGIDAAPWGDSGSLSNARIEFLKDGVWKTNTYKSSLTFDATTSNGQTITFNHNLWRAPREEDIHFDTRCTGWTAEPAGISLTINGFDATSVRARIKLTTPATGTPVSKVICTVR
jgi:hypothetical protein